MQYAVSKSPREAVSGESAEIAELSRIDMLLLGSSHNGPGERMLTPLLEGGSEEEKLPLRDIFRRNQITHLRSPLSDCPRLIQGYDPELPRIFQGLRGLKKDSVSGPHSVSDHDRDRSREAERAGAGDHEHTDRSLQGKGEALSGEKPARKHKKRDQHDHRYEDSGDPIRHSRDRGLGRGRVADHLDNLGEGRILPDPRRSRPDESGSVDRRRAHPIPLLFIHRNGFPGQRGLIHRAAAVHDHAVHRDGLPGFYEKDISRSHLLDRRLDLPSVPLEKRGLRRHFHQILQGVRRPPLGERLQGLSDCDQSRNHGCGFEVELIMIELHELLTLRPVGDKPAHPIKNRKRPEKGYPGAERHEGIHVRGPMAKGAKAREKKGPVNHHHDARE